MKNKSKNKAIGRSLNEKYKNKLIKKKIKQSKDIFANVFICEHHAHENNSCGNVFTSTKGTVSCPQCGNVYCRWMNYYNTNEILSADIDE